MESGKLRHRIVIQRKIIIKNSYGEDTITWVDDCNRWAGIYPLRGEQYYDAQQVQAGITHKIVLRYCTLQDGTLINPNCRIKHEERFFEIISSINPEERNISLEIMAIEQVK